MKCLACGSNAIVEGTLEAKHMGFRPSDTSKFKRLLGGSRRMVRAYGCIHCNHLQLTVSFTQKDAERYQKFEGEQPTVLERINTKSD
ncbi:MAG TPA: hypothetical protein VFC63_14380 [Blastocatellia bacterium]|nr:hypothetical protein [Blastocatellia bacterium]